LQQIDSNKDRQEAAIFVFTIVTVIFLPLSTVAGILGMNTYDVRNMSVNKWVFWATALPLTFLIIVLCLAWAGELDGLLRGFKGLWKSKSVKKKYRKVEDDSDHSPSGRFDEYVDVVDVEGRSRRRGYPVIIGMAKRGGVGDELFTTHMRPNSLDLASLTFSHRRLLSHEGVHLVSL
jgi:hypothetical protein